MHLGMCREREDKLKASIKRKGTVPTMDTFLSAVNPCTNLQAKCQWERDMGLLALNHNGIQHLEIVQPSENVPDKKNDPVKNGCPEVKILPCCSGKILLMNNLWTQYWDYTLSNCVSVWS